jgi:hypothetical protein
VSGAVSRLPCGFADCTVNGDADWLWVTFSTLSAAMDAEGIDTVAVASVAAAKQLLA